MSGSNRKEAIMSTPSTGLSEWERKEGGGTPDPPATPPTGPPSFGHPVISVDEVAKLLGLGRNQIYAAIARGEIDVLRLGRRILILRAPLERKLRGEDSQPTKAA
jgi:excisionase family DNA binding protein